jgi:hypothetical protein
MDGLTLSLGYMPYKKGAIFQSLWPRSWGRSLRPCARLDAGMGIPLAMGRGGFTARTFLKLQIVIGELWAYSIGYEIKLIDAVQVLCKNFQNSFCKGVSCRPSYYSIESYVLLFFSFIEIFYSPKTEFTITKQK